MEQSSLAAEGVKSGASGSSASVSESLGRSKDAIGNAANDAVVRAAADLESLRKDFNGLKDTIASFMTDAGKEAVKSARDVSSVIAGQGATMAVGAAERGKSLVGDLEAMARRNPLGTIAGAVVIGMLIATWGRRR
jgi:ElaB/YqjD/DUF883 family membrane-anchored ribosome-binding protein